MTTPSAPAQQELAALLVARRRAWAAIAARCETGRPFQAAEQTQLLDVLHASLCLELQLIRAPIQPPDHALVREAALVAQRMQDLQHQLCKSSNPLGEGTPDRQPRPGGDRSTDHCQIVRGL